MPASLLPLLGLLAGATPDARVFGPVPPPAAVRRGEDLAWSRRPADRLVGPDRQVVGRWFDGSRTVWTEDALWCSPRWVAGRLGYLSAAERWPEGEVQRRWTLIRSALAGRQVVLVRTSAYPRQSVMDLTAEAPADDRFLEVAGARAGGQIAEVRQVRWQRVRRREEIGETAVWDVVPEFASLAPRGWRSPPSRSIGVGGWFAVDTVLRFPRESEWSGDVELDLTTLRRDRRAVFALPKRSEHTVAASPR